MRRAGPFLMGRGLLLASVFTLTMVLAAAPAPTAGATTPPPPPPLGAPPTTVVAGPGSVPAPTTSTAAATASTTTAVPVPPSTIPRAGSSIGGLRRDTTTPLSPARLATMVVLAVAGLAAAGHVFGRIRSVAPHRVTSTALARRE